MKKTTKQIISLSLAIIGAALLGLLIYRLALGPKSLSQNQSANLRTSYPVAPTPPPLSPEVIAANSNLTAAKQILDQITTLTDEAGFYGYAQVCDQNRENCHVYLTPGENSNISRASWRENLPIIWARFKYYEQTGDLEQYRLLITDINNLYEKVLLSEDKVLQVTTPNCALMSELYFSSYIAPETKQLVKEICNGAQWDYHPQSILTYDQHSHPLVSFTDNAHRSTAVLSWENFAGRPKDEQLTFTSEALLTLIQTNLLAILNQQPGVSTANSSAISKEDQNIFLSREMTTAMDLPFAAALNETDDPTMAANLSLDHLILFNESLSWFAAYPGWQRSLEQCLVRAGITQLAQNYPALLTREQLTRLQAQLTDADNNVESWRCAIANYLAGVPSKATSQLENTRQNLSTPWPFGYAYALNEATYFVNGINAIYAGLLASGK